MPKKLPFDIGWQPLDIDRQQRSASNSGLTHDIPPSGRLVFYARFNVFTRLRRSRRIFSCRSVIA